MKYKLLPNTQIEVSCICLGTMTFGRQNTENDGHQQLDYDIHGVNFIDTAEMYPVPAEATKIRKYRKNHWLLDKKIW